MSFQFNKKYFLLTLLLFAVEIFIALFVEDTIVRPFVGDALVVVLLYCFFRAFLNFSQLKIAVAALFFAFTIEVFQYFDYVKLLGLENNRFLSVIMGRTFEWIDFAAYFIGFLMILSVERLFGERKL
jgi:hypothetical protein